MARGRRLRFWVMPSNGSIPALNPATHLARGARVARGPSGRWPRQAVGEAHYRADRVLLKQAIADVSIITWPTTSERPARVEASVRRLDGEGETSAVR